jgi:hypothetical protein
MIQGMQFHCVEVYLDAAAVTGIEATAPNLLKAVEEFDTCIANNRGFITNCAERYRQDERISAGFVESTLDHRSKPWS